MPPVRVITPADIPSLVRLNQAAGWNQTAMDWQNLMRLAPHGCFGIAVDGVVVATTTAVCYGRDLAWIGMVLTDSAYRGRGFATRLMEHTLEYLRGVDWIKLDATDMGRPLYLKLGFEDECPIERCVGRLPRATAGPQADPTPAAAWLLDKEAFGADRTALLEVLSAIESASTAEAYAMGRPGTKATYFGPCVARSYQAARDLLRWFLARHPRETIFWDLLPANEAAVSLAREFGFRRVRQLVRMARRGRSEFVHNDAQVFAIAGFEFG
jgi:GNAT superfamily N-acetyltransferase